MELMSTNWWRIRYSLYTTAFYVHKQPEIPIIAGAYINALNGRHRNALSAARPGCAEVITHSTRSEGLGIAQLGEFQTLPR